MTSRSLLVVDDSALIRNVLADAFAESGWCVTTAVNGLEAVRALETLAPDLIIADVVMPEMDGWALCETVRRNAATRAIPFIFLTLERDVPKRIRGLRLGADDYVCKPFSKEELIARAEALLRRAAASPAAEIPLAGHSDHLALPDLLQMLTAGGRTGTLHLRGAFAGRIHLRDGRIVNAETQGHRGEKAFFRIMTWPRARFEFDPGALPPGLEEAISGSTSSMLMEGFTQIDELRSLMTSLPSGDRRLRIAERVAQAKIPDPPITPAQGLMLRAASGTGCTIAAILDAVPDRDLAACGALLDLIERGLIVVADSEEAARGSR